MQTSTTPSPATPRCAPPRWWADTEGAAPPATGSAFDPAFGPGSGTADHDFIDLLNAFRPTGGLVRGDALADQMALRGLGGYVALARLIASGEVMSFAWQAEYWLPAFQFDAALALREGSRRIAQELTPVFDGWGCARWLVTPHAALAGQTPLERLDTGVVDVLQAARADRLAALR